MTYKTVKAVKDALHLQGGWLETIRDAESPEYAPHLNWEECGWENGIYVKSELLNWANQNLT